MIRARTIDRWPLGWIAASPSWRRDRPAASATIGTSRASASRRGRTRSTSAAARQLRRVGAAPLRPARGQTGERRREVEPAAESVRELDDRRRPATHSRRTATVADRDSPLETGMRARRRAERRPRSRVGGRYTAKCGERDVLAGPARSGRRACSPARSRPPGCPGRATGEGRWNSRVRRRMTSSHTAAAPSRAGSRTPARHSSHRTMKRSHRSAVFRPSHDATSSRAGCRPGHEPARPRSRSPVPAGLSHQRVRPGGAATAIHGDGAPRAPNAASTSWRRPRPCLVRHTRHHRRPCRRRNLTLGDRTAWAPRAAVERRRFDTHSRPYHPPDEDAPRAMCARRVCVPSRFRAGARPEAGMDEDHAQPR